MLVTVMIGNSDNKLTQYKWSCFVQALRYCIIDSNTYCGDTHFSDGSQAEAPWQNYCIVAVVHEGMIPHLKQHLKDLAEEYQQDSIAVIFGESEMLCPESNRFYAIGDQHGEDSYGMWYGPTKDLQSCLDQTGRQNSVIISFIESGSPGRTVHQMVYGWDTETETWIKVKENNHD